VRGGYAATAVALAAAFALYLDSAFAIVPGMRVTFEEARVMVRTGVLAFYGVAGITGGVLVLREAMRTPSMAARRQAVALAMALLPFGVFRLSDAAFPALSGAPVYPTLEAIALFLLPLCCFLAIHGFRLFEGGLYLRRGLLLGATLTLMVAGATIIVVTARAILPDLVDSVEGFAILCIAAGALMVPLARHLGGVLDTLFFPERVALRSLTVGILQRVAEYTDVRMLCGAFSAAMAEGLSLTSAAVYVLDESGDTFELAGETGDAAAFPRRISGAEAATATAGTAPRPFVRVVPIALGGRMVALLGLGPPVSGELFTEAELHEVELTTLQVAAMVENARLFSLATRDSLTGLARRAVFDEHLRAEAARFSRSGGVFSVLMMDVDELKRVNDRHGHAAGDAVLRAVADAVRGAVRESDTMARYGGEEIAVLLPDTGIEGAAAAAEKLRAAVAALAVPAGAETLHVTISIGAAEMEPGLDAAVLVPHADEALYRAKAAGKNRVVLHAPAVAPQLTEAREIGV